jgi:hypothetical protein
MAGEDDEPTLFTNPYLAAIRSAREQAVGPAHDLAEGLKAVDTAMQANCWQSRLADQFYAEVSQQRTVLSNCETNALAEFDDAISNQPAQVPEGAWQLRWHNLR